MLAIAREIVLRDGIGALTMEALAEAAGVTKPIVYKHFGNSEDVAVAVLRAYAQASISYTIARISGARDLGEFFDRAIDSLFDFIEENGALSRNITSGFSSSERIDGCFLEMQNRALNIYSFLLKEQGVSENRARFAGYALMEMINSTILEFAGKRDPEHRHTLKAMVRAVIASLVGDTTRAPHVPPHLLESSGQD